MLETLSLISNVAVIAAIGALYRKVNGQEVNLNKHLINFTREITERPDFDKLDEKIEKAIHPICKKVKGLTDDFKGHRHEEHGAVIL